MSARASDRPRLALEDILALQARAEDHLRVAMLKLAQWVRTDEEGDILMEVQAARVKVNEAQSELARYHRDYKTRDR